MPYARNIVRFLQREPSHADHDGRLCACPIFTQATSKKLLLYAIYPERVRSNLPMIESLRTPVQRPSNRLWPGRQPCGQLSKMRILRPQSSRRLNELEAMPFVNQVYAPTAFGFLRFNREDTHSISAAEVPNMARVLPVSGVRVSSVN
jgi:hypothetical protein